MGSNELALCWKDHHGVLFNVFEKLLAKKSLVDCTLAAEGKFLKAHRIVLSACSPYFEILLNQEIDKHPILFLKDVHFEDLKTLIEFVYSGEIRIPEDRLVEFLNLAEALQIKGLGGAGNELPGKEALDELSGGRSISRSPPVPRKRFRRSSNSESSCEANDNGVERENTVKQIPDDKVPTDASSDVPSPSCKRTVASDELSIDVSKVKVEISNSSVTPPESVNSEQLLTGDVMSKSSEEILGLKTEFEQVTLPENYSGDMLLEENDGVEPVVNQDQPSSSHQYSGCRLSVAQPPLSERASVDEKQSAGSGAEVEAEDASGTRTPASLDIKFQPPSKFQCPACPQLFQLEFVFLKHLLSHHDKMPYRCPFCSVVFTDTTNLVHHISLHTGNRPFACMICKKRFAHNHSLKEHIRLHTGERPYKCVYCSKGFIRSDSLNYHLRTHTGERPYKCHLCEKSFRMKQHMQNHLRTHVNY